MNTMCRIGLTPPDHGDDNKTRAMPPAPQESTLKAASLYELAKCGEGWAHNEGGGGLVIIFNTHIHRRTLLGN